MFIIAKALARHGFSVFADQDYESRVRGGHNFYRIRIADRPVMAAKDAVDIVVALDRESIEQHGRELTTRGQLIYERTMQYQGDRIAGEQIRIQVLSLAHAQWKEIGVKAEIKQADKEVVKPKIVLPSNN